MSAFCVTVRTGTSCYTYTAINACSADVVCDAIDRFGLCCVVVKAHP
jgi:hypothetical protein